MSRRGRLFRVPGASGTTDEALVCFDLYDPVEGAGQFAGQVRDSEEIEILTITGAQLRLQKIARQVTSGIYPDKGTGAVTANATNGGTTLKLAANVLQSQHATIPAPSLLIVMTSGAALGDVRAINSFVSGTQTATVNRAWTSGRVPLTGDTYELLIDCRFRETLVVKPEFSTNVGGSNPTTAQVRVRTMPLPFTGDPVELYDAPLVKYDAAQILECNGKTANVTEASFGHGTEMPVGIKGVLGAQIEVDSVSAGNVSLWMGAR